MGGKIRTSANSGDESQYLKSAVHPGEVEEVPEDSRLNSASGVESPGSGNTGVECAISTTGLQADIKLGANYKSEQEVFLVREYRNHLSRQRGSRSRDQARVVQVGTNQMLKMLKYNQEHYTVPRLSCSGDQKGKSVTEISQEWRRLAPTSKC